jgi:hypothetical protein
MMNDNEHPIIETILTVGSCYLLYQGAKMAIRALVSSPKPKDLTAKEVAERHGDRYQNGAGIWFRQ